MTISYNTKSFDWQRFCIHYESKVIQKYQKTPSVAAEKIKLLRSLHRDLCLSDTEPDVIIDLLQNLTNDRGEIAAFCDPERIEDAENLIEGYDWCVNQLPDKSVAQDLRHFCAAQVSCFDEMLQYEEIDI